MTKLEFIISDETEKILPKPQDFVAVALSELIHREPDNRLDNYSVPEISRKIVKTLRQEFYFVRKKNIPTIITS